MTLCCGFTVRSGKCSRCGRRYRKDGTRITGARPPRQERPKESKPLLRISALRDEYRNRAAFFIAMDGITVVSGIARFAYLPRIVGMALDSCPPDSTKVSDG